MHRRPGRAILARMGLASVLRELDGRLEPALGQVGVPCYLIDRDGVVRWVNEAAQELLGPVVGRPFTRFVAPEDVHATREIFARKLLGRADATDFTVRMVGQDGRKVAIEVNSVPVHGRGGVVGVFGVGRTLSIEEPGQETAPALTPRQHEILRLLAHGMTTVAISTRLGLSIETVRNHVRGLLRALGAHSRLEAVAVARRLDLLP